MKKIWVLPLLAAYGTLHAQQNAVKDLEPVVVTGQGQPVKISQSLYPITLIDAKRIQEKGAVNLMDLLTTEMNMRIISDNVLGSNLIMQGITGQNVKILVDGVPMISGEGNEFDLQQLHLNQVERVEIIQGPLSVEYGTNALAGTINLITRRMKPGEGVQGGISQYLESVGQYNGSGWLGKNMKGWNLMAGGGYTWFGGYASDSYKSTVTTPDGTVRGKNWNPKTQATGNLKLYRKWGELQGGISLQYFNELADAPGNADPGTAYLTATDNRFRTSRATALAFVNGKLNARSYLDVVNSYSFYDRTSEQYLVNLQNKSEKQTSNASNIFANWTFRAAYNYQQPDRHRLNYQLGYDVNLSNSEGDRVSADAGIINDIGLFSRLGATFFGKLEAQGGLRYTYNNRYNAREINFLGLELPLISSLQLRWTINEHWYMRAGYTRGFRAPSQRELFQDFKNANHYIIGNPDLNPELAHNYSAGVHYKSHAWKLNLTAFLNNIRDKIELVELDRSTLPPAYQTINVARTYHNIPEFSTRGVNLDGTYSHADRWQLKPSLGYLSRSGSNSMQQQFGSWEAGLQGMYNWKWLDIRFTSAWKYNGPLAQFGINDGKLTDRTLGGYHLWDLSATRSFLVQRLMLTIGMKNLLNVTDVIQTGDGKDGLMLRSGFKPALPVAWGRTGFVRGTFTF
ncbi:MAG: TonB-dependent receptor [Chitinophaga sp.]|uniref:TonB-dependent receptor plug domain-containing protein n=1 Tax=Chitinophaga sp. TaxID=1869181 RepID=UPI0025B9FDB8|nr:TonB-dependent receptor [Chitinophaga sp.]MBV8256001.1 TonB-dependent receptor [Chitinophaga sp.]